MKFNLISGETELGDERESTKGAVSALSQAYFS